MLILKIISPQPQNVRIISRRLKQISSSVNDGFLGPALHMLERNERSKAEWQATKNNRRAKSCSLTYLGRSHLGRQAALWSHFAHC
jgi:DNA-binding PadR family transcriptional regulator